MPALLQICIVIVTIAVLAVAVMAVRMMSRVIRTTEELSPMIRESAIKFDRVTHEAQALVASLREVIPPVQRVMGRVDAVSQRAADLSSALLNELELPVFAAAAVARGVRSGANHFLMRMVNRLIHRHSPINGG